jgi:hypothetical protein
MFVTFFTESCQLRNRVKGGSARRKCEGEDFFWGLGGESDQECGRGCCPALEAWQIPLAPCEKKPAGGAALSIRSGGPVGEVFEEGEAGVDFLAGEVG